MKGMCQTCGETAPLEWFAGNAETREMIAIVARMPREVSERCLAYLRLFRPPTGRAMAAKKALRLIQELEELVAKGYVSRPGRPDRDCPARIWGEAIDLMLTQSGSLDLPMPNHNYLVKVAWGKADKEDAGAEAKTRDAEPAGGMRAAKLDAPRPIQAELSPMDQYIQGHRDDKPGKDEMDAWNKKRLLQR